MKISPFGQGDIPPWLKNDSILLKEMMPKRLLDEYLAKKIAGDRAPETAKITEQKETKMSTPQEQNSLLDKSFSGFLSEAIFSGESRKEISGMVTQAVEAHIEKRMPKKIVIKVPDQGEYKAAGIAHPKFEQAMRAALTVKNVMFVGPSGCGKTFLAHQIAEAMNRPFASISCTAGMSESHLLGWLLPVKDGAFEYHQADFVRLYENGGVFLLDEMDGADPNILLIINQALANGGFHLPQRKNNTFVKRHDDFVCVAACNTFGTGANTTYAGRERLDESTLDRFRAGMVTLDYDSALEQQLVDPEVLGWGLEVRRKIRSSELRRVMSTRFLLDATKLKKSGMKLSEIKDTYFSGWKDNERSKVS